MNPRFSTVPSAPRPAWVPNLDVFVDPSGNLIICVELSGVGPSDVEIKTEGLKIQIAGKRASSGVGTARTVLVHEINSGPFETVLELPAGFDLANASSHYSNGTLVIMVPGKGPPAAQGQS